MNKQTRTKMSEYPSTQKLALIAIRLGSSIEQNVSLNETFDKFQLLRRTQKYSNSLFSACVLPVPRVLHGQVSPEHHDQHRRQRRLRRSHVPGLLLNMLLLNLVVSNRKTVVWPPSLIVAGCSLLPFYSHPIEGAVFKA